jgi:F0F1-type ATP synthase assembly protein I
MIPDQKKRLLNSYARYSGMAFQMLAIILLGVFAGFKLDHWLNIKPILTIVFSFGSVVLAIYYVTRDLLKKK